MTIHHLALLVGLFVAPAWFMLQGHRLRDRTRRGRSMFWGAVTGHTVATIVLMIVLLSPPSMWQGSTAREYAVYWLLLAGTAAGVFIAAIAPSRE